MRLKELADLQFQYSILERTKMTKKALCDLIIPFRDKYALTDGQALSVARRKLSLSQIEKMMRNKEYTNADLIRAMSDEELAKFIPDWSFNACKCDEKTYVDCNNECEKCVFEWLQQPAEVTNG